MVTMMDGTFTELGPQVPAALFGYFIGIFCCLGSFSFGRNVYDWLRARHATPEPDSAVDEELGEGPLPNARCDKAAFLWNAKCGPLVLCVLLTAAFIVGDAVEGITFYRQMWMSLMLAPLGALLRWKLSEFNTDGFPRGTLAANITAAGLYALLQVLTLRYGSNALGTWASKLLSTLEIAFCGSLSTVSTLIKEITDAPSPAKGHLYGLTTIVSAMFLGLAIYSPIARW
jgi:fluoride ion exporter CrcB/FEX